MNASRTSTAADARARYTIFNGERIIARWQLQVIEVYFNVGQEMTMMTEKAIWVRIFLYAPKDLLHDSLAVRRPVIHVGNLHMYGVESHYGYIKKTEPTSGTHPKRKGYLFNPARP